MGRLRPVSAKEVLDIAVAAGDGGGDDAVDGPAEPCHDGGDIVAHGAANALVAHDAFAGMLPSCLELRLHERDEARAGRGEGENCWQDQLQRDEAHVEGEKTGPSGQVMRAQGAGISLFAAVDTRIGA